MNHKDEEMIKKILEIAGHRVELLLPSEQKHKITAGIVIYMHGADKYEAESLFAKLEKEIDTQLPVIANIKDINWYTDLTPWPAEKIFKSEQDFKGEADHYIQILREQIIVESEEELEKLGVSVQKRGIIGYSLAGLFALYLCTKTDIFTIAASVSGSLWYDDFLSYYINEIQNHHVLTDKIYLSVGDKEAKTRNQRTRNVQECTEFIHMELQKAGVKSIFELNPGNHFTDVPGRMTKAVKWLIQE